MTSATADRWRMPAPSPRTVVTVLMLSGAMLLGAELMQGWYPHDEGALGQSAERVLLGEHPHRDFDEIYTGLLTYLNAAVFAVTGPGSQPMRIPLYACALGFLWAMYRIMCRFAPPAAAALVAMIAFTWSVPNYPAPLPSWYVVFASSFGVLAMIRWTESRERRWLVVAGAMGAVAFLMKLHGVLFLLGAGLALLAIEDQEAGGPTTPAPGTGSRGAYAIPVALAVIAAVAMLAFVVGRRGEREILRFVIPISLIAAGVILRLLRPSGMASAVRWRSLVERVLPFALGALVPVGLFVAWFAIIGGLPALVEGVFVAPFRRVSFASHQPPSTVVLLFALPFILALGLQPRRRALETALTLAIGVVAAVAIYLSNGDHRWYKLGWFSAWGLLFVAAIEGLRVLRGASPGAEPRRTAAIPLACVAVALALMEYPFAAPIYTLYGLPLTMLAVAAMVRLDARLPAARQAVLAGAFLAFGLTRILPGTPNALGMIYLRSTEVTNLELPRGGLLLEPGDASLYEGLIAFVQDRAAGRPIWAGPDSPEVYFYAGIPNRTRTLFDFLDAPAQQDRPLVERLDALDVGVVVLKVAPLFSLRLTDAQVAALRARYPHEQRFPRFLVLWR